MIKPILTGLLLIGLTVIPVKQLSANENAANHNPLSESESDNGSIIYETENLVVKKLSDHIYQHVSFLQTDDYGKVACNGMLVVYENEGVLFDTPIDDTSAMELLNFTRQELKTTITAVIPTHFHEDCVGGIKALEKENIPVYVSKRTAKLLRKNGLHFANPITTFKKRLALNIGTKKVYTEYFGPGHTQDNVVGYFPESNAVFGGCLIKSVGASKGYLGDAHTDKWSETVRKVKAKYPNAEIVIPGHGKPGGTKLFDYTIALFQEK